MISTRLKLTFISGLVDIVIEEISHYSDLHIISTGKDFLYLDDSSNIDIILNLRSITNIYLVRQDEAFNPHFLAKHKSILGDLITRIRFQNKATFSTFKLSCAGAESKEVQEIQKYIADSFKMNTSKEADLELYIGKLSNIWEVGVRFTKRPLSLREYKVANIEGALNPTIAYAMNALSNVSTAKSYLNIFSGSATLLIEASYINPECTFLGFDNNGKTNALAIQNIKSANKLKSIHLKTLDIFEHPSVGTFDCITSDLPFGMQISKGEDLSLLYSRFVMYCETVLHSTGSLVIYTTEHALLEKIIEHSKFTITKKLDLKVSTSVSSKTYIYPKVFVCKFK